MNNAPQYQALYSQYQWLVPYRFNIAEVCCRRWAVSGADARRIAIYTENEAGGRDIWTYERLFETANRLAHGLTRMGVQRGDRVAVILPQCGEAAAAHLAIYQMGAICVPLSPLFGPDALEVRLRDSETRIAILDNTSRANLLLILHRCPALQQLIGLDYADEHTLAWRSLLARQQREFTPFQTLATDPAMLLYTAGTTGVPKGVLQAHASLIGGLPGFVASQDWFPHPRDVFWSPADWSWTGGLMNALLPTLYFGRPIVATRSRCTPEQGFELLERYQVTNAFLLPATLKGMMKAVPQPRQRYRLALRSITSSGEPLGQSEYEWCRAALQITPNEMYGQTEMNHIIGNSGHKWPVRPGSMGLPYPGHRVALIDAAGEPVAAGEIGEIALNRYDIHGHPDPSLFLGYWRNETATAARYTADWCRTGDLAHADEEGYLWYDGRVDDMFKSAGYRIGPTEIENCLTAHPAVANAAIIPKPDPERGTLIKAFVVLTPAYADHAAAYLTELLQDHIQRHLAPYESPQEIEFVATLPMTTTGKLQRSVLRKREYERAARARPTQRVGA